MPKNDRLALRRKENPCLCNKGIMKNYSICTITKCAETARTPPANGVIVKASAVPSGLRTVSTEFPLVVSTNDMQIICDVPVARPTTIKINRPL